MTNVPLSSTVVVLGSYTRKGFIYKQYVIC